jgi:replicative DNA helicase
MGEPADLFDDDLEAANLAFAEPARIALLPFRLTGEELRFPLGTAVRKVLANLTAVAPDGITSSELVIDLLIEDHIELSDSDVRELRGLPMTMIASRGPRCAAKVRQRFLLGRKAELVRLQREDLSDRGLIAEERHISEELYTIQAFLDDPSGIKSRQAPVQFEPLARIEVRDLGAFPVEAMGVATDFVNALAAHTQTPTDLAGVAVLGFMAGAVARKFIVRAEWDEEIALYLAAVAEPGSRKSEVWKQCARPTELHEAELRTSTAGEVRANEAKLALLNKRLTKVETSYASAKERSSREEAENEAIELREEIAKVLSGAMGAPRLLVTDVTPERLATLLAENGERMILASAEGGQIFDRMFRYSQNGDPNMDLLLSGWSGERCSIDRQNAEGIILRRPVLTIVGAIQPYVLEELRRQRAFDGRGLTARFAYAVPPDLRGYRNVRSSVAMDHLAARAYEQVMTNLLQLPHDPKDPGVLHVTGKALELFVDFREVIEIEQRDGGLLEDMRGWASKAPGLLLRIAGVLALAEANGGRASQISSEIMKRAIELTDYFVDHSKRAFEIMAGDTGDPGLDKLWRWITSREEPGADFSRWDAWQGVKGGRFTAAADLGGPLDRLVRAGRIAQRPAQFGKTGRPPKIWAVNPDAIQ